MNIPGPMIAEEDIQGRERLRNIHGAAPEHHIQMLASVGVIQPKAVIL